MKRLHICEYSTPKTVGEDGIIRGVKILGRKSENGRTYRKDAVSKAVPLYEGAAVFMLHPNPQEKRKGSRQLADHFGSLMNVNFQENGTDYGLFGDLPVKKSHPMAAAVLESIPNGRFGLSHNAHVELTDDESEVVEIVAVNSVDLVDNPATTKNLFEQADPEPQELRQAFTELRERLDELFAAIDAGPSKKKTRLSQLESRQGEEVDEADKPIGNSHDAFLDTVRGFSLKD